MKSDGFSMKINEKSWIFVISQCFLGNLGSMKSTPQSYVRAYYRSVEGTRRVLGYSATAEAASALVVSDVEPMTSKFACPS